MTTKYTTTKYSVFMHRDMRIGVYPIEAGTAEQPHKGFMICPEKQVLDVKPGGEVHLQDNLSAKEKKIIKNLHVHMDPMIEFRTAVCPKKDLSISKVNPNLSDGKETSAVFMLALRDYERAHLAIDSARQSVTNLLRDVGTDIIEMDAAQLDVNSVQKNILGKKKGYDKFGSN